MSIIEVLKNSCKVEYKVFNSSDFHFNSILPITEAGNGDVTWLRPGLKNTEQLLKACNASCLICNNESYKLGTQLGINFMYVVSERPDLIFLRLLKYLNKMTGVDDVKIHPTSIINQKCVLGNNVSIGAFSIIKNAIIGDNCIIGNNVQIFDNVVIGRNCIIREFCSIGGDGFNFVRNEIGELEHMPHIGKVIIEDNVHIFPYTNIDRATLTDTKIGKGTKIDHYCHIGHNSHIGKNTLITAQVVTCGGSKIGENCFIGVNTLIRDNVTIGNNVITGLGAVVTKNIPDSEIWVGNPASKMIKK